MTFCYRLLIKNHNFLLKYLSKSGKLDANIIMAFVVALLIALLIFFVIVYVAQYSWNNSVSQIFGLPLINFTQMFFFVILIRILF